MLATQIKQKGTSFYFIAFRAEDLLERVRFLTRFYGDGGEAASAPPRSAESDGDADIARFIAGIERRDKAFQREVSRRKVKAIRTFYENALSQPPIPGAVLLFTEEKLRFHPVGQWESVGELELPREKFLIIDGQHRLAALRFYLRERPREAAGLRVPCMIFDGSSEDFAAEMFVTINSTASRINKSHLVDLYEKVSWEKPDKKMAARIAERLYTEADSPLRYKIDRLGGRSRQEKWILQAELFNELHKWRAGDDVAYDRAYVERAYGQARDILACARGLWPEGWGNPRYMITRPVTLKALLRVGADLAADAGENAGEETRMRRWMQRLAPWKALERDFRADGFYERFVAKGQLERVASIHRRLAQAAGLEPRPRRRAAAPE